MAEAVRISYRYAQSSIEGLGCLLCSTFEYTSSLVISSDLFTYNIIVILADYKAQVQQSHAS